MAENPISGPITNLQEAQTALLAGFIDEFSLVQVVIAYLDANPELYGDGDLAEIAHLNQKRRDAVLRAPPLLTAYIVRAFPDFDPKRDASHSMGRAFLKRLLEGYLRKEYEPWEICRHVSSIEWIYDYPEWIGNLYNACDWVGEGATRECHRAIEEEAEILVAKL